VSVELCRHCLLPIRRGGYLRTIHGEPLLFCCYGCALAFQVRHGQREEAEAVGLLIRLAVGGFFSMNTMLFSLLLYSGTLGAEDAALTRAIHWLLLVATTAVMMFLAGPFIRQAWQAARQGRLTSDTLISLGTLAAFGYSAQQVLVGGGGIYFDTVTMVLLVFTLGRYLEAAARSRAARSLEPMLAAERAEANVVVDGADQRRPVRELALGAVVRVRPGERVPVDGVVIDGCSECDEAILTGEPRPQPKSRGSWVYAGSLNGTGQLMLRMSAAGAATRWGEIAARVRQALARSSPLNGLVDQAAGIFVPAVILLALGVVSFWSQRAPFEQALMAGLAVLVVACPCALGLAAPLATALGFARALERGVLIRSGAVFEGLARARGVAFDKTGTLTQRAPQLTAVLTLENVSEGELLQRAAGVALGSEHPLARGIIDGVRTRGLAPIVVEQIQAHPGAGAVALAPVMTAIGSSELIGKLGWSAPADLLARAQQLADASSVVYVGWDGVVYGVLLFRWDAVSEAKPTIETLKAQGLPAALLSGDTACATEQAAQALGIEFWRGGLSAEDKVLALDAMAKSTGPVVMVGDGLNDAPVLASASVGIAVGAATDLARETADVVLPPGGLRDLPWLVALARRVRTTMISNIAWAFGYNLVALAAASAGLLQPILAAALMAGSSFFVLATSAAMNRRARDGEAELFPPTSSVSAAAGRRRGSVFRLSKIDRFIEERG
jgi:Cu2+-exporting ATPase